MSVIPSLKKFTHDDYPARSRQKQYSRYTRPIDADTLLAFRYSIRLAPVFLQKRIQKKAEYRLILISKHDFVYRIEAKYIAVLKKVRYALCPRRPMPTEATDAYAHEYLIFRSKGYINDAEVTLDWRVTEPDKLVHIPEKLPIDYLNELYQMLDELGLNLGAFDIIRDEDDTG